MKLEDITKIKKFPRVKKKDLYDLITIDRNLLLSGDGRVKEETILR